MLSVPTTEYCMMPCEKVKKARCPDPHSHNTVSKYCTRIRLVSTCEFTVVSKLNISNTRFLPHTPRSWVGAETDYPTIWFDARESVVMPFHALERVVNQGI